MKKAFVFLFTILLCFSISAQTRQAAFLSVKNLDVNPQFDYLQGIIEGLLLFDLSHAENVVLVDRKNIDKVLQEKELQLSGLVNDQGKAIDVGKILKADFLISGEYVVIGTDILFNLKVIHVETARTVVFTERGGSENTVHAVAEKAAEYIAGKKTAFQSPQFERSLISLKDESPGTIALHSPIIQSKIFLDEEFVGYTTGNVKEPFVIEKVKPGKHKIRTHLDHSFGVIILPEIIFKDWEVTIDLQPGKRMVLQDETTQFNWKLAELSRLLRFSQYVKPDKMAKLQETFDVSFIDRTKKPISVKFALNAQFKENKFIGFKPQLVYDGQKYEYSLDLKDNEETSFETKVGLISLELRLNGKYQDPYIDVGIWRNDIQQGMFEQEN